MLACIGLVLLGDYRPIVFSKRRFVVLIKVFLHAVLRPAATTEYFGIFLMVLSAWFFLAALVGVAVWLGWVLTGLVKIWSPLGIF